MVFSEMSISSPDFIMEPQCQIVLKMPIEVTYMCRASLYKPTYMWTIGHSYF